MPSASASTTTCRPICPMRSAPARPRCCAWSPPIRCSPMAASAIKPTLIDRIQDRYGHTIYQHDQRECRGCDADEWNGPGRADAGRPARAGARSDDRLPDHLDDGGRGAARHRDGGDARSASRSPARPAPPTTRRTPGSSASRPTSWSASIIGYDKPRHIGQRRDRRRISRRRSCSDFMKVALADKPAVPFRVPPGIKLIRVDAKTGMRAGPGDERRTILEAFKPGTAPPDTYSVIGVADADGAAPAIASRRTPTAPCVRGTGGLVLSALRSMRRVAPRCASRGRSRYIRAARRSEIREAMRAEIEKLVDDIKQSVGLLRRHL